MKIDRLEELNNELSGLLNQQVDDYQKSRLEHIKKIKSQIDMLKSAPPSTDRSDKAHETISKVVQIISIIVLFFNLSFSQSIFNGKKIHQLPTILSTQYDSTWLTIIGNPSTGTLFQLKLDSLLSGSIGSGGGASLDPVAANTLYGNETGVTAYPHSITAAQGRTILGLATVATSGSYADLSNKPFIPAQPNFTAGSNVVFTGTYPNISISSSGGGSATWGFITGGDPMAQTDLAALFNSKQDFISVGTTSQYYRGDKSWQTLNKTAVGLANVDNVADVLKPLSNDAIFALSQKQDQLVSGTNIKKINNIDVIGSGNITIAGSADASLSAGPIQFPPVADSVKAINNKFIVIASGTLRNNYHYISGTPPFNEPIIWKLDNSSAYGNTFFTSINADPISLRLILKYPLVKNIISHSTNNDEISYNYLSTIGTQILSTGIEIAFNQYITTWGIRFKGDGLGSWTVDGTLSDQFTTIPGNGFAHFYMTEYRFPIDYKLIQKQYVGPHNYRVKEAEYGGIGGFVLVDQVGDTVNNPTTDDIVTVSGFGLFPSTIDLYKWRGYNEWLRYLSSFTVQVIVEAWMIGEGGISKNTIYWQPIYPNATTYKIYRSTIPNYTIGSTSGMTLIHSGTSGTYEDTGLANATIYYYKLMATVSGSDVEVTTYNIKTK